MMTLDILRALAGIAASETIQREVKEQASILMIKIMGTLEKMVDIENQQMKKASAEMNGIIS